MNWKKFGVALLFPKTFVVFFLFNLTAVGLTYIFVNKLEKSLMAILFYGVASYTMVIVCARIPAIVKNIKSGLYANKYSYRYLTDRDLRMKISMYRGLLISCCFAVFKMILGFIYHSAWLHAMAGYNVILSFMRFIVIYRSQKKGFSEEEEHRRGLQSYQVCGWLIMVLNIAVSVIMYMVIVQKQTIEYHMIVTIGLATYTFYCFIMAIINMIKYRERTNPVYAAVKRIDMVKAMVSVFTLQVAMLTSFGEQGEQLDVNFMNTVTGFVITIGINAIGAMMLVGVKRDFKEIS